MNVAQGFGLRTVQWVDTKVSKTITLCAAVAVLFTTLTLSMQSVLRSAATTNSTGAPVTVVQMPASISGSIPVSSPPSSSVTPVVVQQETILTPLKHWPSELDPIVDYVLKTEYHANTSHRWEFKVKGTIALTAGRLTADMESKGWSVTVLYSSLGVEVVGVFKEAKISIFIDPLLDIDSKWVHITGVYQSKPLEYVAPSTTLPSVANPKA